MYRPEDGDVAGSVCCLPNLADDPPDRTAPHGEWVLEIARYYATDASIYLFLAGEGRDSSEDEQPRIPQLAFARAIDAAIENEIDLLNVSAGRSRPNCTHGQCFYCTEVERAIDEGVTVVAAAGNSPDAAIHCPGNATPVICVGGVEYECTYNMPRVPEIRTNKPPFAYWTRLWSGHDYPESAAAGSYCTTRGCWSTDGGCEEHLDISAWDRNPIQSGEKPDIFAPIHYAAMRRDQRPFVWAASSFAAPVVTGCLAGTVSTIDSSPSPYIVQQAVREGASQVEPVGRVFDAGMTRERLLE